MKKILIAVFLFCISCFAQQYEQFCPSGTSPIYPTGVTSDGSNGMYRQWLCVDFFGNVYQSTNGPGFTRATSYGVLADTNYSFNGSIGNGSSTISCSDCGFTPNDVGKIIFATNLANTGFGTMLNSVVRLPQGVIQQFISPTTIIASTSANAACLATSCLVVYGHDDSVNLNKAWLVAAASCSTLILPAGKMLIQSAQFNIPTGVSCAQGVGGSRAGIGIRGFGINISQIIPTPNFSASSCASQNNSCFFGTTADGIQLADFEIFGAGVSNPGAAFQTLSIMQIIAGNNADIHNVSCLAWGANGTNGFLNGYNLQGGSIVTHHLEEDGCGQTGIRIQNGDISLVGAVTYDNSSAGLYIQTTNAFNPIQSIGSLYGGVGSSGACIISIVGSNAALSSSGDNIGGSTAGANGICVGYFQNIQGGTQTGSGVLFLNNASVNITGNASQSHLFLNGAGDIAYVSNSRFTNTNGLQIAYWRTVGTSQLFDTGGNSFGTGTLFSVAAGTIVGANSITGTAVAAGNFALSAGWGTTAAMSGLSGFTRRIRYTITASGTGQLANPTLTYTYPNPFPLAPICSITQDGGTQAAVANPFTVGTPTATSVVFTYTGTPVAGNTLIGTISCDLP